MGSFKFPEANAAVAKYCKITTLLRLAELLFFLIMVFQFSIHRYAFSLKQLAIEYFRLALASLTSARFVFVLGNAIVLVLCLLSRQFSSSNNHNKNDGDFYEQYAEKCSKENEQIIFSNLHEKQKESEATTVCNAADERIVINKTICRSYSEVSVREPRRDLRRSKTELAKNDMSSDEFRQTVDAFIARRQRFLREEEEEFSSAVVTYEAI